MDGPQQRKQGVVLNGRGPKQKRFENACKAQTPTSVNIESSPHQTRYVCYGDKFHEPELLVQFGADGEIEKNPAAKSEVTAPGERPAGDRLQAFLVLVPPIIEIRSKFGRKQFFGGETIGGIVFQGFVDQFTEKIEFVTSKTIAASEHYIPVVTDLF